MQQYPKTTETDPMITTLSAEWPEPSKIGPYLQAKEVIPEVAEDLLETSHSKSNSLSQLERDKLREGQTLQKLPDMSVLDASVDQQNMSAQMSRIEVEQSIEQPREIPTNTQNLPERMQSFVDDESDKSENRKRENPEDEAEPVQQTPNENFFLADASKSSVDLGERKLWKPETGSAVHNPEAQEPTQGKRLPKYTIETSDKVIEEALTADSLRHGINKVSSLLW